MVKLHGLPRVVCTLPCGALASVALLCVCFSCCGPRQPRAPSPAPTTPTESPAVASANGLTREAHDQNPPGPPGSIRVEHREGTYLLEWNGTRDDTITGYQIFRRNAGGAWQSAAFVKLHADDERNRGTYTYSERSDAVFEFTVAAVDARGVPGPKTSAIH